MLLVDSLSELHPDKLLDVLKRHIDDGRAPEVRQAIPYLSQQHPQLRDTLTNLLPSLEPGENGPDMISGAAGVAISCTNCGGTVTRQSPDTTMVICLYCGCNAEQENPTGLSQWKGKIDTQADFSIGSFFTFREERWQATGVQKYSGKILEWDSEDSTWLSTNSRFTLWWMLNEQRELAWLSDQGNKRYWSEPYVPNQPGIPEPKNKKIEYGDWTLDFAAGEFSYHPQPQAKRKTWEFLRTPKQEQSKDSTGSRYSYTTEASLNEAGNPSEIEFFRSIEIADSDVLRGLGSKIFLATVNRWRLTGLLFFAAAALTLLSAFIVNSITTSEHLLEVQTVFGNADEQPLGDITIEKTGVVLQFQAHLNSGLEANRWTELEIELEDSDGVYAGGYYVEFWRETGYDDGPWDESDYRISRNLRIDEPGTYSITGLIGATNAAYPFSVTLRVISNPTSIEPFLVAIVAGIIGGILSFVRSKKLANSRSSLGGRLAPRRGKRKNHGASKHRSKKKRNGRSPV